MVRPKDLPKYFETDDESDWVEAYANTVGITPMDGEAIGIVAYLSKRADLTKTTETKLQITMHRANAILLAQAILSMARQNGWPIPAPAPGQIKLQGGGSN